MLARRGGAALVGTPFSLRNGYHHKEGVAMGNRRGGRAQRGSVVLARRQRRASAVAFPLKGGGRCPAMKATVPCSTR
jgi:hypothetical protein